MARRRGNFKYQSLIGGLNTSYGVGTINQSQSNTDTPDSINVEPYKLSGVQSMMGNSMIGNQLPSRITLGYEYINNNNKYKMVATFDGTIYRYNRLTNEYEYVYQFPNQTLRHSMTSFNQGVLISNGIDAFVFYQIGRNYSLNGTISGTEGSPNITGVGTNFTLQLHVGDYITINGESYIIQEITSDTALVLTTPLLETITDSQYNIGELSIVDARLKNSNDPTVDSQIRGLAIQSYQGRIFVGGNDGVLYYSELGLYQGWDVEFDAGGIPSFYNDNSDFSALGIHGQYLVIHKMDYTYLLDGTSDTASWQIQPFADTSCDSQQSWISCNNAYYVYSRRNGGIYPLMSRTVFSNTYLGDEISKKIRESFFSLNTSRYDNIFPVYHPTKKYLMFYMPLLSGLGSNHAYCYDFISRQWWLRRVPQDVSIAFRFNDKVYIGTTDGKILEEFRSLTFDGEPIDFYWRSPWFEFGTPTDYKSLREFRIEMSEESANDFFVRNRRNGRDEYKERRVDNDLPSFEALVWSDDEETLTETVWDEYDWVAVGHIAKRFPLPNTFFYNMQVEFGGNLEGQAMQIYGFELNGLEYEEVLY